MRTVVFFVALAISDVASALRGTEFSVGDKAMFGAAVCVLLLWDVVASRREAG